MRLILTIIALLALSSISDARCRGGRGSRQMSSACQPAAGVPPQMAATVPDPPNQFVDANKMVNQALPVAQPQAGACAGGMCTPTRLFGRRR